MTNPTPRRRLIPGDRVQRLSDGREGTVIVAFLLEAHVDFGNKDKAHVKYPDLKRVDHA